MSAGEPEKPKEAATPASTTTPTPSVPSVSEMEASLRTAIKTGVDSTNKALARLQERVDKVGGPVVKSLHNAQHEGAIVASMASDLWQKRKQYGPEIIAGSSILVGGIVGIRRGRIPAVASATLTGFFTYLGVYELDFDRIPDVIFGREQK